MAFEFGVDELFERSVNAQRFAGLQDKEALLLSFFFSPHSILLLLLELLQLQEMATNGCLNDSNFVSSHHERTLKARFEDSCTLFLFLFYHLTGPCLYL